MRRFILIGLMVVWCVGCASTPPENPRVTPRVETSTEAETAAAEITPALESTSESTPIVEPEATPEVTATAASQPAAENLLIALRTNEAQQIALIDRSGSITPLIDIPLSASRVTACGDEATSPDGRVFAFYAGATTGSLYLMNAAQSPALVDEVEYAACLGNGTFQFAPDSQRFAYIDYTATALSDEYADGVLKLYETETVAESSRFENVTAFDLSGDGVIFVSFFTNNRNEADEAAVTLWDGTAAREVATLLPTGERCRFTSASIAIAPDEAVAALVLGQRCSTGNPATRWQFYLLDLTESSATLAASDYQPGAFVPYARGNTVFFSPEGLFAYFTVPDGITASTVAIAAVRVEDATISVPLARQVVVPSVVGSENAYPRFSPDGRWLALVVTSPDNDNQIVALDLSLPDTPPIVVNAGSRSDQISGLAISPDSAQVIYIAGGTNGGDNTLLALNLALGSERRILRGHFGDSIAISPDGGTAALLDWQRVDDPRQPLYTDLVLVDLASSAMTTLFAGADVVNGEVRNQRSVVPLAWR